MGVLELRGWKIGSFMGKTSLLNVHENCEFLPFYPRDLWVCSMKTAFKYTFLKILRKFS